MKQLTRVFLLAFLLASSVLGQNASDGPNGPVSEEPVNHAIVVDNLKRYHDIGEYEMEIRQVANAARDYLASLPPQDPHKTRKQAAVFDIDETSLSNWEVMAGCGFCSYPTQLQLYKDKIYSDAHDPAIAPVLELFNFAKEKNIAVFFITGRTESQRPTTEANLKEAGYSGWTHLYMQPDIPAGQPKQTAQVFKPKNRQDIETKGYEIVLNIGDQASDLVGCCSTRVFKLPNPFYLVP